MIARRRHSAQPMCILLASCRIAPELPPTVLAFTSTETNVEGRLTRQFFSDCCRATSAWTTLAAGFFGGMMRRRRELWVKTKLPHLGAHSIKLSTWAEVVGAGVPGLESGLGHWSYRP